MTGQRIVTKLPLTELWDETGALPGERIRYLDGNLIRGLMGTGQVQFIIADCGAKLNWIPMQERFEFWKAIRPQVADAAHLIVKKRMDAGRTWMTLRASACCWQMAR
jgi:hypothetical protein